MERTLFAKEWGIAPPIALFSFFPLTLSFAKLGFNYGPPILFISFRMIACGLFLLIYYFFFRRKSSSFCFHDWRLFFSASVIGIALAHTSINWALKHIPVSKVAIILLSTPFFSIIFEHFHSLGKLTEKKMLGLFIVIMGIAPMLIQKTATKTFFTVGPYELAVLLSAAGYSYGWISVKRLVEKKTYSTLYINGLRTFFGGILALIASSFIEGWIGTKPPVTSWMFFLKYVGLAGLVALTGYSIYGFLLKHYPASVVSFCSLTEPLFASLYAWILLGETVSKLFFVSLITIPFGFYLFYQKSDSKEKLIELKRTS